MSTREIVAYIRARWPHLTGREVRRCVREVSREDVTSTFLRTESQRYMDILVRTTQIYEIYEMHFTSECSSKPASRTL